MDVCSLLFGFSLRRRKKLVFFHFLKINVRKYLLQMFVYFTQSLVEFVKGKQRTVQSTLVDLDDHDPKSSNIKLKLMAIGSMCWLD